MNLFVSSFTLVSFTSDVSIVDATLRFLIPAKPDPADGKSDPVTTGKDTDAADAECNEDTFTTPPAGCFNFLGALSRLHPRGVSHV
jgi:hypothetical protein